MSPNPFTLLKRTPPPKRRQKPRRGRLRDRAYMEWIRSRPCVVCEREFIGFWFNYQHSRTEAAHVGPRGLGQKSSDRETIPLCAQHHRLGKDSIHRLGKRFWEYHGLDRDALIAELNRMYEERR